MTVPSHGDFYILFDKRRVDIMKKSFAILTALAIVMVMLLTACGGSGDMTTEPNSSNAPNMSELMPEASSGENSTGGGLLDDDNLLDGKDDKNDKDDVSDKLDESSKADGSSSVEE